MSLCVQICALFPYTEVCMEVLVIFSFVITLTGCVVLDVPILYALAAGYFIFSGYAVMKRHSFRQIMDMSSAGFPFVKNILIVFILVGMLTALWRAAGTIPAIVFPPA